MLAETMTFYHLTDSRLSVLIECWQYLIPILIIFGPFFRPSGRGTKPINQRYECLFGIQRVST